MVSMRNVVLAENIRSLEKGGSRGTQEGCDQKVHTGLYILFRLGICILVRYRDIMLVHLSSIDLILNTFSLSLFQMSDLGESAIVITKTDHIGISNTADN